MPGFIDLQINGAFGIDVMSASPADLLNISQRLPLEGTTAWLPTVITAPLDQIERVDRVIAGAMALQREARRQVRSGASPPLEATILGMHLEGPFISPKRLGAHPPANLLPTERQVERVLRLETLKLVTLAPELKGALDAIDKLVRRRVAVSIGHTEATYDQAIAGIKAGARMFTHLFNAMPPLHHRAPGAVGAALSDTPAMAALIPDSVHVDPTMLRIVWRARRATGTILTTDRTSLAGCARTGTVFGDNANTSLVGGAARLADGTLAGSVITMLDGIRIMRRVAEVDAADVMSAASHNPARLLRLRDRGNLIPRSRADLLLLDSRLNLKNVFIGGREID